jgi:hypothetical protein
MANENPYLSTRRVTDLRGATAQARAIAKADAERRKTAAPRILNPSDMQGEYDAARLLMTTLGGQLREITADDLAAFRHNARAIGQRFKGGITPRQVIDLSTATDRQRAREQIHTAIPTAARAVKTNGRIERLEVRFITNASKLHGATRHFVTVEFLGYPTAIASGALTPQKAAALMRKQGIRFDCGCGRHTFWYRHIATVGNYHAGRAEHGYPKIRNPQLTGVACKHVLRVMAEIEGGSQVQVFLARAIAKGRTNDDGKATIRQSQKEAERLAEKQAKRPKSRRATGDRDFERAARALVKQSRAATARPKREAAGSKRANLAAEQAKKSAELRARFEAMAREMGLTPEQARAILNAST